jgi:hypothetical protein
MSTTSLLDTSPKVSLIPLPTQAAIETEDGLFGPAVDACFVCKHLPQHKREWISDPKIADHGNTDAKTTDLKAANPKCPRGRTLVLCFDGTGDSFDADVGQFSNRSYPGSRLELITCDTCRTPMSCSSWRC